ncbi:MAG TPA: S49 family peptidase, partial [Phycisphaerae bacterium]
MDRWSIHPARFHALQRRIRETIDIGITLPARKPRAYMLPRAFSTAADAARNGLPVQVVNGTAIVSIDGVMVKMLGLLEELVGGFTSTLQVQRAIEAAAADNSITRIVLRIDSPGGSVDGLAELADAILAARQVKPVIAQGTGLIASAAYYAASQATEIRAQRMDLVGAIGTIAVVDDWSGWFANKGIKVHIFTTGAFKAAGTLGTELTKEQQADYQRIVDSFFTDFRRVVTRGRGSQIGPADWSRISDGRVWPATEAQSLKLIDRVTTMDETMRSSRPAARPSTASDAAG